MFLAVVAVLLGVAMLAGAADQFVVGAARVALIRQVPSLVVGVVIIGFGTSLPEMIVSTIATVGDEPEIAIGNIVGSNIVNLSLLLGVGALIVPIRVDSRTVRREAPLVVGAMVLFAVIVQGGLTRLEGLGLLAAMAGSLVMVTRRSTVAEPDALGQDVGEFAAAAGHRFGIEMGRVVIGLTGTVLGAQALLWGAIDLADRADLSEGFVGATLVSIGTSLPELVTVIQSARRRETDLIVGNLLGSNLFNALGVGGIVGIVGMTGLSDPTLTGFAAFAACGVAMVALASLVTGHTVTRREGVVLVVGYLALVPFLA